MSEVFWLEIELGVGVAVLEVVVAKRGMVEPFFLPWQVGELDMVMES